MNHEREVGGKVRLKQPERGYYSGEIICIDESNPCHLWIRLESGLEIRVYEDELDDEY